MEHAHRNLTLAHLMKSFGNLENSVTDVVKTYFTISVSTNDLSRAMLYLAVRGKNPVTGKEFTTKSGLSIF